MQQKTIYLLLACALLLLVGCGDNSEADGGTVTISDPSQHIQGKWQDIARGNDMYPELTPSEMSIEFLSDGTYHGPYGFQDDRNDGEPSYYRIASDSLYMYREQGSSDLYIYRYLFIGNNQLLVNYIQGVILKTMHIPKFHIFKRIK
jgi:hypothetical protein